MRPYYALTDAELLAEIAEYQAAKKKLLLGGDVAVVAGEGRRLEYTKANSDGIRQALRDLLFEASERGLDVGQGCGGAIAVEIG